MKAKRRQREGLDVAQLDAAIAVPLDDAGRDERIRIAGLWARDRVRTSTDQAEMFIAAALLAYLEQGGELSRDWLRFTRPKSHQTPQRIWARQKALIRDEDKNASAHIPCGDPQRKGRSR